MDYPSALLPKSNYKFIDCNLSNFCLLRHSHIPQEDLLDDIGNLKNDVIVSGAEKYLPDFSMSLYGIFQLNHINIRITNLDYQQYCDPNTDAQIPIFGNDFELVKNRGYWTVMITSINNQIVDFEDGSLSAVCKVRHTPMLWNFWHFSINWYINEIGEYWHNQPKFHTRSTRRKLISEGRGLLKEFSKPFLLSKDIIGKDCYIN